MLGDIKPFRILGNLYFVGTNEASSHLIDTGEGLILINTGYAYTADVIVESMSELGFDIKDVKYIIHTHGHYDHTGGTEMLVALSGAKTFLAKADERYIVGFKPDYDIQDGDVIRLGNTEILCLLTPGHTEGTVSLFWNIEDNGVTYRAGTFGGAGTNQLKKSYLDRAGCSYLNRGLFFQSIERLKKEHVDVFIGNHAWQNHTKENYELMQTSKVNPFVDETKWGIFLEKLDRELEEKIQNDSRKHFINYAHRGASEYAPENTFTSFHMGINMKANGIETDVQRTKDGVLVLFHDNTLERWTEETGRIADYTLEELKRFTLTKNGYSGKIVVFEEFLKQLGYRKLVFAIEIKQSGIEEEVVDMMRKYDVCKNSVVTSFMLESVKKVKAYAPDLRVGFLTRDADEEMIALLKELGVDELCPRAKFITTEKVQKWHREGFNVRAWGVFDEELMRHAYDCGVDGMTVNFPDKLVEYMEH